MIADNLTEAADIVHKACQCDMGFCPDYPDRPDEQAVHALLHEAEYMLYAATDFGLLPVAGLPVSVSGRFLYHFSHMMGVIPHFLISSSFLAYLASR